MNFFKKLIKNITSLTESEEEVKPSLQSYDSGELPLDELFVKNFISKGGKFLYCSDTKELEQNLLQILHENKWNNMVCFDEDLNKFLTKIKSAKTREIVHNLPFFTVCEALTADDGSIMFSSKQLKGNKLKDLPGNFVVFAKTSQLVKSIREGVMAVRSRAESNSPTIVSSVKNYTPDKQDSDFMSYGNTNSKVLYLLLLEDL
jgi:L-lactate utilization protein LutC